MTTRISRALAAVTIAVLLFTFPSLAQSPFFKMLELDGHQVKWEIPADGKPLVLTYRLINRPTVVNSQSCGNSLTSLDDLINNSKLSSNAVRHEISEALRAWEAVTNVKFVEVETGEANVLIGAQVDPIGWAFADVFYGSKTDGKARVITKGLVCFNPKSPWKIGFDGDKRTYDLRFAVMHEIGHVLGLDHPADSENQIMGFKYHERFRTPQSGDILAATKLYGIPATRLAGVKHER
jgi:predicted Zn-dependent protease